MPTKQASKSKARRASASPRPTPLSPPHLYCTHRTYSTHSTVIGGGTSYRDCEGGGKGGSTHREPKKGEEARRRRREATLRRMVGSARCWATHSSVS